MFDIKRKNKNPKKRKLSFYINRKLFTEIYPFNGWFAFSTVVYDENNLIEIRKEVIDNLYWLLGEDCTIDEWQGRIERYDKGRGVSGVKSNLTSLFLDDEEKSNALNSFYNQ